MAIDNTTSSPLHNSSLDACANVHVGWYMRYVEIYHPDGTISLTPSQSLSLLTWLEQERPTLKRLAIETQIPYWQRHLDWDEEDNS